MKFQQECQGTAARNVGAVVGLPSQRIMKPGGHTQDMATDLGTDTWGSGFQVTLQKGGANTESLKDLEGMVNTDTG